jgi:hypothetical protein
MATSSSSNYSNLVPKKHHDVLRVLLLCIVFAVLIFVAWIFSIFFGLPSSSTPVPLTPAEMIAVQKENMIQRLQAVPTKRLTKQEAVDTVSFISNKGMTFTTAEKDLITNVLSAQ